MVVCLLALLLAADAPLAKRSEFTGGTICSREGWCWELPRPQGLRLAAFWGSGPKDVWAAGERGTLIHFDGVAWSGLVDIVPGGLRALWGSGPNDVWAAGEGELLHFDGEAWTGSFSEPTRGLGALAGRGSANVWAVGGDAAVHFDGKAWSPVPVPAQSGLAAVWFEGESVFAQGWTGVFRFDGKAFVVVEKFVPGKEQPVIGPAHARFALDRQQRLLERRSNAWVNAAVASLERIEGSSFRSVSSGWVVTNNGGAIRFDGKKWTRYPLPNGLFAHALWERAPDDAWAVDLLGAPVHFDGKSWTTPRAPCGDYVTPPAASVAGEIWTVTQRDLCRLKGNEWQSIGLRAGNSITAIGGSSADDVWIAIGGDLVHWNGEFMAHLRSTPERMPPIENRSETIRAVWARTDTDAWGVGEAGVALRWDGERWARIPSASKETLRAIWSPRASDLWAVGDNGAAVHWNGTTFAEFRTPPMGRPGSYNLSSDTSLEVPADARGNLTGIWGSADDDVWAVGGPAGARGTHCFMGDKGLQLDKIEWGTALLHWDGKSWKAVDTGDVIWLKAIWGRAKDDIWAIGDDVLMHFDGRSWTKQQLGGARRSNSQVLTGTANDLFIIGERSVLRFPTKH